MSDAVWVITLIDHQNEDLAVGGDPDIRSSYWRNLIAEAIEQYSGEEDTVTVTSAIQVNKPETEKR